MTIDAKVVEILNGDSKGLGEYKFEVLPSPKDRIVLPSVTGDLDIMEVLYVEHTPVKQSIDPNSRIEKDSKENDLPYSVVYVRFADRYP